MKLYSSSYIAILAIIGLAAIEKANCQTYQISQAISLGIPISDSGNHNASGSTFILPGSLSETVYLDPNALTLREAGSFSFANTANVLLNETRQVVTVSNIPAIFPNPPYTVSVTQVLSGTLTAGVSIGQTSFAFDTGLMPVFWNGQKYAFNGAGAIGYSLPADFLWSLLTGGQTYSGGTHADLTFKILLNGGTLDTTGYPSSLGVNGLPSTFVGSGFLPNIELANFTASNGFEAHITAAPEPSSFTLIGFSTAAMLFWSRRKISRAGKRGSPKY